MFFHFDQGTDQELPEFGGDGVQKKEIIPRNEGQGAHHSRLTVGYGGTPVERASTFAGLLGRERGMGWESVAREVVDGSWLPPRRRRRCKRGLLSL
jgi:hypothetical protein